MLNEEKMVRVAEILQSFEDVAIVFHKNPDGDAIGSAAALFLGLKKLNKRCKILSFSKTPEKFDFLFKGCCCEDFDHKKVVAVDLANANLLEDELVGLKIDLVIDHHVSNDVEADFCLVDETAAATCEVVFELLIRFAGVEIDREIAMSLYVGIVTDTGCFRFSNTTSKTHKIAADLLEFGIDFADFNRRFFEMRTFNQLKLQSLAIQNLQFCFDGRCCFVVVTKQMFSYCGCDDSDSFVVLSVAKSVVGVCVSVVLKQIEDCRFKASVRTSNGFSALRFCEKFGGGGHEFAAGFEICSSLDEAKRKIFEALGECFC